MKRLVKWMERLSLDAVLVAVCWCASLGAAAGDMPDVGTFAILALAVWLAYVADRLWEVRPGRSGPSTDRHSYYQNNYTAFRSLWLVLFPLGAILGYLLLPQWQFLGGWVLVALVGLYLWIIGRTDDFSRRLLLKRTLVPLIFTGGVTWMAAGWTTVQGLAATGVLLFTSLANVLLISLQENRREGGPPWLGRLTGISLFLLLVVANGLLPLDWMIGLAALYAVGVYFVLYIRIRAAGVGMIRMWVDAALLDAGLIILILKLWLG